MISNFTKFLLPSVLLFASSIALSAAPPEGAYGALQWREIGPFRGGRAVAVAGVPGSPNVFYFGAAAGGAKEMARDLFVPVDFEAAYTETCRRRRVMG